jgi:hypothetical protein
MTNVFDNQQDVVRSSELDKIYCLFYIQLLHQDFLLPHAKDLFNFDTLEV